MIQIRPIEPRDNEAVGAIIINTLREHGCIGPGYASNDPEIQDMYSAYQDEGSIYWVLEDTESGSIVGGCGFSRLKGTTPEEAVCELQKLYFTPQTRGKGLGKTMLNMAMDAARKAGYRQMYLETVHQMETAIAMYRKHGFQDLATHRGNTGHHERCTVRMQIDLVNADATAPAQPTVCSVS